MNLEILRFLSYTLFSTMVLPRYRNRAIYFRHHGSAVVLPADDLAEWHSLDDFGRMREVT